MSTEQNKESVDLKELAGKASDLAKNIWLAGLGAYGKAIDEAQGQYDKVTGKVKEAEQKAEKSTMNLFEELVSKGKKLEEETTVKFNEVKDKASDSLDERIEQVKTGLTFSFKKEGESEEDQLKAISEKLDTVLASLGSKPAVKKTAAKKTSPVKEPVEA